MNCKKCNISVMDRMLHRATPIGEQGEFMCMPCIESSEPELAKNIKDDEGFKIAEDVQKAARD